jgi:hypothetical protein
VRIGPINTAVRINRNSRFPPVLKVVPREPDNAFRDVYVAGDGSCPSWEEDV